MKLDDSDLQVHKKLILSVLGSNHAVAQREGRQAVFRQWNVWFCLQDKACNEHASIVELMSLTETEHCCSGKGGEQGTTYCRWLR